MLKLDNDFNIIKQKFISELLTNSYSTIIINNNLLIYGKYNNYAALVKVNLELNFIESLIFNKNNLPSTVSNSFVENTGNNLVLQGSIKIDNTYLERAFVMTLTDKLSIYNNNYLTFENPVIPITDMSFNTVVTNNTIVTINLPIINNTTSIIESTITTNEFII